VRCSPPPAPPARHDIYNATWPYVAVIVLALLAMSLAPGIVLFLPHLMY
jgi:TRAP-type C4-dicarboxylate transport system permease large subunit